MNITVDEMIDLSNRTSEGISNAYKDGVRDEKNREREIPNTIFDALIEYGKKSKTLIDYNKSGSLNWVQLKPTRDGSEGVKCVEISFEENLMEICHIGITIPD